jgi:hypothetical protein
MSLEGELWSQADPGDLLWFWWGCNEESQVQAFTLSELSNVVAFSSLLSIPVHRVYSTAGDYDVIDRRSWSKIVNLETLSIKARALADSSAPERERKLAVRFLNALARAEGDPMYG